MNKRDFYTGLFMVFVGCISAYGYVYNVCEKAAVKFKRIFTGRPV